MPDEVTIKTNSTQPTNTPARLEAGEEGRKGNVMTGKTRITRDELLAKYKDLESTDSSDVKAGQIAILANDNLLQFSGEIGSVIAVEMSSAMVKGYQEPQQYFFVAIPGDNVNPGELYSVEKNTGIYSRK